MKHIVPLANFFGVDCNYLLTGISAENKTVWEDLGLHENSVRFLKDLKSLADKNEVNSMAMILITDLLFRSGAMTHFLDMINQYVYDQIEAAALLERDEAALSELEQNGADRSEILRAVNRLRTHENTSEFIWFKSAVKANEIMNMIIERAGGLENFESAVFGGSGRTQVVPEGFGDLSDGMTISGSEQG